jgi:hypothetical protein
MLSCIVDPHIAAPAGSLTPLKLQQSRRTGYVVAKMRDTEDRAHLRQAPVAPEKLFSMACGTFSSAGHTRDGHVNDTSQCRNLQKILEKTTIWLSRQL